MMLQCLVLSFYSNGYESIKGVDGLNMKELIINATIENLSMVQEFIETELKMVKVPMKLTMQILIATEEIYVNIAHYAYSPNVGKVTIQCSVEDNPQQVVINFLDKGKPFDPLQKEDADTTLTSEERDIGGLGILMVKKSMDSISYQYENGMNILTIQKRVEKLVNNYV